MAAAALFKIGFKFALLAFSSFCFMINGLMCRCAKDRGRLDGKPVKR